MRNDHGYHQSTTGFPALSGVQAGERNRRRLLFGSSSMAAPLPKDSFPYFKGYSVRRWENGTLVFETVGSRAYGSTQKRPPSAKTLA
jgi:hypothetical protein